MVIIGDYPLFLGMLPFYPLLLTVIIGDDPLLLSPLIWASQPALRNQWLGWRFLEDDLQGLVPSASVSAARLTNPSGLTTERCCESSPCELIMMKVR